MLELHKYLDVAYAPSLGCALTLSLWTFGVGLISFIFSPAGSLSWAQSVDAQSKNGNTKAQMQHTKPSLLVKGIPVKYNTQVTGTSSGPSLPPSMWSEDDSELLYKTLLASMWDGDSTVIGSESYG